MQGQSSRVGEVIQLIFCSTQKDGRLGQNGLQSGKQGGESGQGDSFGILSFCFPGQAQHPRSPCIWLDQGDGCMDFQRANELSGGDGHMNPGLWVQGDMRGFACHLKRGFPTDPQGTLPDAAGEGMESSMGFHTKKGRLHNGNLPDLLCRAGAAGPTPSHQRSLCRGKQDSGAIGGRVKAKRPHQNGISSSPSSYAACSTGGAAGLADRCP